MKSQNIVKIKRNKSMIWIMIIAIVLNYILPINNVFANAPTNNDGYATIQINGATTLENVNNEASINATYTNGSLTISGTGLYSNGNNMVYVPIGSNVTLDANGNTGYTATIIKDGDNSSGSTVLINNIEKKSNDAPYIIDVNFENGNNPPQPPVSNNENATINYNYNGGGAEFNINGRYFDVMHATASQGNNENTGSFNGTLEYPYDNSGTVTIEVETLFISRLTSLIINNVEYAASPNFPTTPNELLNSISGQTIKYTFEVPYSQTYSISTVATPNEGEYMTVGNFLWSYMEQDKGTDDYIGNGSLELLKVKYNNVEYTEDQIANLNIGYMQWGESPDEGGALLPVGAEVTVKLLPDPGYQLTSFTINGGDFEAGNDTGVYTFEVPRGNFHLGAHFTKVRDKVNSDESDAITSGNITLGGNESSIEHGTAVLDVKDVNLDDEQISNFEDAAGDYKISNYLDISLYNTIYKGTATDTWDEQILNLDNKATITLRLAEDVDGNEIVIVHQKHDGTYEVIETTYDPVTHTISFTTDSFSNYAIASKTVATNNINPNNSLNPNTGDNIINYILLFVISIIGISYTISILYRRKRYN